MTGAERAAERVYEELLTRVGEANPRPRIEPVRRLAELVGSPQLSYPVIQVAGTNGKTSTSRAIESLVRAHGLRTGLFTSPHLVDFTERFQIDGVPVGGKVLADAWDELRLPLEVFDAQLEAEGMGAITFFEALAVLAFTLFADAPVDVAVIEVGMGGEWDATNIADAQVAVFTPIDLDHTAVLGTDIETIARTKAGIVKQGSTVVTAAQDSAALVELVEAAEREDARIFVSARDFDVTEDLLAVGGRQVSLRGLTLEFLVAGQTFGAQRAIANRPSDRTAGFSLVAAVAEPAGRGEIGDLVERCIHALVRPGHFQRADAGGVDEQRAARQDEQLAMGGRVPAPRVVLADGAGDLAVLAEQGVDERRLPDA